MFWILFWSFMLWLVIGISNKQFRNNDTRRKETNKMLNDAYKEEAKRHQQNKDLRKHMDKMGLL